MNNVKAGIDAVVIKSPMYPQNVGLLVHVIAVGTPCTCGQCPNVFVWECESLGRPFAGGIGFGPIVFDMTSPVADVPDAWLRPVSGIDDPAALDTAADRRDDAHLPASPVLVPETA